ncbi:MAG: hypothetical protein KA746_15235 [Pyrinomonadaceae bacterium]|nr:hypothetical protein [Pyrinomonadaceae bacterium]MBP6213493.1 hypothetical protein [Pyrinomonadaceae bacterium]
MQEFDKIGDEIEAIWRRENYDEALFPSIAAEALKRSSIPQHTDVWKVVEWCIAQAELPRQRDLPGKFGDPPVTVYSGPRFHIDIYFWFEGTTAIHQHGFCGAFQVMHGSSIHSWYEFDSERSINTFAQVGQMKLRSCDLLQVGDVQQILGGKAYIHSLFHLDQPSATIVVRTDRSPLELPQYSYYKPNLAIDPFFEQETVIKKTQLAGALLRAKHTDAERIIGAWLADCDFQTTFNLLTSLRHLLRSNQLDELFRLSEPESRFEHYLKIAEERHGKDVFRPVFRQQDLLDDILKRRSLITNADLRFFLALLLNVEGSQRIFGLIKQRSPDADPLEKVLDWTYDLANSRIAGSERSNVLGINDFGDVDLFVLEQVLKGLEGEEIAAAFRADFGEAADTSSLAEKENVIRRAPVFAPLLA